MDKLGSPFNRFYHRELYAREVTPVDALGAALEFGDGLETLGGVDDAKVTDDTAGTVSAKLRGLSYLAVTLINNLSSYSFGTSSDAKVSGDSAGTLQAKIRGINTALALSTPGDGMATGDSPKFAAMLHGVTQGSSPITWSAPRVHDSQTNGKANSISGIVVQSRGWIQNGAGTDDRAKSIVAAKGTTGTGIPASGPTVFDGTNYPALKGNTDGSLPVGGFTKTPTATLTRPNDTNTYTAGDAVADSTSAPTALTFANCARIAGGTGFLTGAQMIDKSNQAVLWDIELWVFNDTVTPTNDQDPFNLSDADILKCVGVFHFTTSYQGLAGTSGNRYWETEPAMKSFTAVGTSLYGLVVVRNAYVALANEVLTFALRISQD
jgi:hypothetical protein